MNVAGHSSKTQRGRRPASKSSPNAGRKSHDPKARKTAAAGSSQRSDPRAMIVTLHQAEKIFGMSVDVARARHARLTERQRQVAALMAQGKANREIAEELTISPKTLDIHRADVMHKLEADTVARVANTINLLRQAEVAVS
jgi:DNA-binding NarL/FixJ family response regulator